MVRYYIELDNGRGQKGYASYINLVDPIDSSKSADGTRKTRISITKYPGRAMSYLTEDDAEKAMMHFEQTEGLNREEATIVPLIHDEIHELWLGGGDCPDGVAVMRDEQVVTFLESDRILVTAFVPAGVTG